MPDSVQAPVGLIGIGLLGTAIAERWLAAGQTVVGFDLSADRRDALHQLGGDSAKTLASVAKGAQRILLSLPNSNVVAAVVSELLPHLSPGALLVDTTTGDPEASAMLGEQLAQQGIGYVDATVAGSSTQTRRGEAIVMAGGPAESLAACQDLLTPFARQTFHVGPWGSGARMKLVVNLVLGLNRAVLAEGLVLAMSAGLDPAAALEVLKAGPAQSLVMETKGPKMLAGDFTPEARLAQHLKDVDLILELGERSAAALPLSSLHKQLLKRAVELGFAEADNCAVIRAIENWNLTF